MTTTDHAAEARRLIGVAEALSPSAIASGLVPVTLETAQAHATLALAAEQRTTNRLLTALIDQIREIGVHLPHAEAEQASILLGDCLPTSDWERLEGWRDDEGETADGR
mgnify:CR=1 FL=1